MDSAALNRDGKDMLEYIAKFWDTLRERKPLHNVTPGYLTAPGVLPDRPPDEPEELKDVLADIDKYIMPGMTQWNHPHFFAYFPSSCSYPSIVADMLCSAVACIGFTWNSSPACTELEIVMMNWLGRLIQLPEVFLNTPTGRGGGIIQGTASEATLVALLAARSKKLDQIDPKKEFLGLIDKLVCYTSELAHSSVERASLIAHVKIKQLPTDSSYSVRGEVLQQAINEDRRNGLIPFYMVATIGTTSVCSYDNLKELGEVCAKENLWLHIDAAYAGNSIICPEYRYLIDGVELADSYNFNPHKWMMTNFDCSAMWFKDCHLVANAFNVDPLYLQHKHDNEVIDFRHLQIPLGRRFRSLKLWFGFRLLGVKALQENIRTQIALAKEFEKMVRGDRQYEIIGEVTMGLVCFRLKDTNAMNEALVKEINDVDRRIHLVPGEVDGTYFLRMAIASTKTTVEDVVFGWKVIQECVQNVKNNNIANGKPITNGVH
ncbi:DDC [Bugula neritina]|uniref:Aromatic-L-amino-acid decarboxylase n=1 Tax=Bugula neritina TaxID=10212 RepID=A0A7J7KDN6_BUGNE|nr:DDC [Bugula neritina]